ncbi:MAG: alanine--tRNA ligase-related protein [Candidatus Komeilibacteria bacterium]
MITTRELRQKYLDFFKSKNHAIIDGASLLPENDASVLFTTAGMHPLVPYLLGEKHPAGQRLADAQGCIRTGDIEEVGDDSHLTFFEMLGNWSLGDYFKEEAIAMSWEFLTGRQWLGLDKNKIAISVFAGDDDAPRDEESAKLWLAQGLPQHKIAYLPKENNWWGPAGQTGPCGPDSEMFYWVGPGLPPQDSNPGNDEDNWLEIWNDVFMQYSKQYRTILVDGMHCLYDSDFKRNEEMTKLLQTYPGKKIVVINGHAKEAEQLTKELGWQVFTLDQTISKDQGDFFIKLLAQVKLKAKQVMYFDHDMANIAAAQSVGIERCMLWVDDLEALAGWLNDNIIFYEPLLQKNVDTGMGLERTVAILNGFKSVYEIDTIKPIYDTVLALAKDKNNITALRVITDHLRAAIMIMGDRRGVMPSNVDQGYVVRRLLRSAIRRGREVGITDPFFTVVGKQIIELNKISFPSLKNNANKVIAELIVEEEKFSRVLEQGELKVKEFIADGKISGEEAFQLYSTYGFPVEEIQRLGVSVDIDGFKKQLNAHQELSRAGAQQKFAGGLADHSEATTKLHTATHLLHAALRKVLGDHVVQKGSNITAERLRFDFSHPDKLTAEQIEQVENLVNDVIAQKLAVTYQEMSVDEAKQQGALGVFDRKYGDKIKVYSVGEGDKRFSCEICGGPHVKNTAELGHFRIKKEQASSAGVRRIKAVVE